MKESDAKIEEYRKLNLGYMPVLRLDISQVPVELGDPSQAVRIEFLMSAALRRLTLKFAGVLDLKMDRLHPGSGCLLQIDLVADAQMEGIRYRVSNGEQDLILSFYCWDFSFAESEL